MQAHPNYAWGSAGNQHSGIHSLCDSAIFKRSHRWPIRPWRRGGRDLSRKSSNHQFCGRGGRKTQVPKHSHRLLCHQCHNWACSGPCFHRWSELKMVFLDVGPALLPLSICDKLTIYRNAPLGVIVIAAVWMFFFHIHLARDSNRSLNLRVKLSRMDVLGITLFLRVIYCLLLALQWGGDTVPWKLARIIGSFIGFSLLGVFFFFFGILQWRGGEHGTIRLRILLVAVDVRRKHLPYASWYGELCCESTISLEFLSMCWIVVWLADWTVCILVFHLFPIHSGRLGNLEWCLVYRHGAATDCGTHHHANHCDCYLLCHSNEIDG